MWYAISSTSSVSATLDTLMLINLTLKKYHSSGSYGTAKLLIKVTELFAIKVLNSGVLPRLGLEPGTIS